MDDKAYTCFYCHSILPYDVCISGTHFCLQATNAIEFWGNVVKIASTNSVEEQDGEAEATNDQDPPAFKEELDEEANGETQSQHDIEENEESAVFPEMECEEVPPDTKPSTKALDEALIESQDGESDGVKPMNWRLKMIALVKQRPPLYDKRLPLSERTFPIRAKLWKEVYDGLNGLVPIDLLPKRFKVLRDRYNKEVKRRRLGHPPRKPWSLFKYLDFLSHAKKKICIRKMSLANGECKLEDSNEKLSQDKLISASSDKVSIIDEDTYKENLEIKKKFVQLVGERPPLYDCRLPRPVRVAENKVKLWREIYEALHGAIPLVDLPRKFKSLRDRYMKEKKKADGNDASSNWPLMEYMTYLDDVAYIRSSQDNHLNGSTLLNSDDINRTIKIEDKKSGMDDCETEVDDGVECSGLQAPSMSPLNNISPSPPRHDSDGIDMMVPDDIGHKDMDEDSEILLNSLNYRSKDSSLNLCLKNSASLCASLTPSKVKAGLDGTNCKLKKLDLLDAYDNWTEDDFFGAYLVKLMKKLPLDERLRLHVDIINMITQSLKNQQ